ncbi:MAG: DNA-binding protein, partial [Alphaproteobacteria bacterium]
MSSREIADLVGSRHDSVKRTVERLVERKTVSVPPVVEYRDGLGRAATE